jgi:hypothetical protein
MCARSRTFPRLRRLALAQTCTAVACFSLAVLGNVSVVLARPEKRLWARNNNTRVFIYYRREAVVRVGVAHARIEAKVVGSVRTARCVVCAHYALSPRGRLSFHGGRHRFSATGEAESRRLDAPRSERAAKAAPRPRLARALGLGVERGAARGAHLGGKTFRDATTNPIYATCSSNGKSMMRSRGSQAQVDRLAPSRPEPASCSCNTWHISGWWSHQIFFPSRRAVGVIERGDRTYFFRVDERNPFPSSLLKRKLERARGIRRGQWLSRVIRPRLGSVVDVETPSLSLTC